MTDLSDAELAELERLCAGATPGPWGAIRPRLNVRIMAGERYVMESGHYGVRTEEDAQLIAAARNALPRLLAELKRRRG